MKQMRAALFDFDGTLADTEPLYDVFWNRKAEEYRLGIPDFAARIKGTVMPHILANYFSAFPESVHQKICAEAWEFEENMNFPLVPGALEFLRMLKAAGYPLGLVTSSETRKIERAFRLLPLGDLFDTVVTADRITRGKPDPMCYRLAAADLKLPAASCLVFEDALTGIRAATDAGMRVIGLSTTNPPETLRDQVFAVIPDFLGLTVETFESWC